MIHSQHLEFYIISITLLAERQWAKIKVRVKNDRPDYS